MKNLKRYISFILSTLLLISCMNVSFAAEEQQFQSEKLNNLNYVENYIVDKPFAQTQALDCAVGIEDGLNVMYTTSSAKPAIFNVFDLDNMILLRSFEMAGTASSWEHNIDKEGNVYIITTDKSRLFRYSPKTKELKDLGSIDNQSAAYQSVFDDEGNLYIGTYPAGSIVKYDPVKDKMESLGQVYPGNDYVRSLSYYNGNLYAGTNGTGNALIVKVNPKTGEKKNFPVPIQSDKFTEVTNVYAQTNVGRYSITYGANGKGNNCWMVFDYQDEKWTDTVITQGGGGTYASPLLNGKSYFNTANGMKAFNVNTGEVEDTIIKNSFTGRKYFFIDFPEGKYEGFGKNTLVTVSYGCQPIFVNVETGKVQTMTQATMKGGYISLQHVATGQNDTIYLGAYMGSQVAMYNAKTGEFSYMPMGQTENIKKVGDKMYFGEYAGGNLYEFDPSQPVVKGKNPKLIVAIKNDQDRPYIIDGDETYIVAGSIATYGKLGGAITIYNKKTQEYEVLRNIVQDHSVVGLAIKDGLIYGSTTVSGGLGIEYTEKNAKIFVYDIEKKQKIKEFIPEWSAEMQAIKEKDGIKIIGDLEFGPDGLLWGATQGYVFALDPATLKTVKSKIVGTFDYSGTGHFWMPRHIRFDKDGLLYSSIDYGIVMDTDTMEYMSLKSYTKNKSNIMDIDSEGNIYFGLVGTIRKVARAAVPVTNDDKKEIYNKLGNSITLALDIQNAISKNNIQQIDPNNTVVRPITKDDRTLLPVRFIAESLNAEVSWNDATQTASLKLNNKTIDVPIGKNEIYINGTAKAIDVPAQVINDRTLLPLRALAEALDKEVFWDDIGLIVVSDTKNILDNTKDKAFIEKTYSYLKSYAPVDYVEKIEQEKRDAEIAEDAKASGDKLTVMNNGFDDGSVGINIPSWTPISTKLGEGMIYKVSDTKSYNGGKALYLEDISTTQSVGVFSDPIRVEKNQKYQLKVKLFIESGRTSVSLRFYDEYMKDLTTVSENVQTGQSSWQDIIVSAQAPSDAKYVKVLLNCSNLWMTQAYYDYVRLYKD